YDNYRELPVVCGVDGVGTLDDGTRVYFGGTRHPYGTMAQRTVITSPWYFPLPDSVDDATAAALPNAAMSALLSLDWRAKLQPGETVLILGATGAAGKQAIQLAKHLGAKRVIAAGRNRQVLETLPNLGADDLIQLDQPTSDLTANFVRAGGKQGFDVVIDYVWGKPTEALIAAVTGDDLTAEARRTRLIEVGEMAGANVALPAAALRSSGLEIYGSGGGSVPQQAIFDAFQQVMALASEGKLQIDTEQVPLAEVEQVWQRGDQNGRRIVLIPR
ncbi:MAG TPA: zinc-binding alcohol dehydrogenase family protein, partial [Phototrophicaceae bacterium]|nr:zinc-binding alcohol dehydrogenase family protein [Phototrophicaceae bacterium]